MKKSYSKLKDKGKYNFFLTLLIALMSSQLSWGQIQKQVIGSFPVMDGGFEGQPIGNISSNTANTTVVSSQTKWLNGANSVNGTIGNSGARSGNNYLSYNMSSGGRQVISPYTTPQLVASTDYIVQFYYKSSTNPSTNLRGSLFTYDTSAGTLSKVTPVTLTLASTFSADTWLRASVKITSNSTSGTDPKYINCAAIYDGYTAAAAASIDDFVIYAGTAVDVTAPNAATSPVVAVNGSALDVSWTAPDTGVDGGGYIVVRYAVSPNADNDPNVNGIYAVGNTITNGTGALTGTVVYIGTATSFTDTTVASNTNYYYKIYTVDKAFNYSAEIVAATVTTWNGISWSNTTGPTASIEAIIDGTYSTTTNGVLTAKKLTVNSGSLTINTGTTVTVQNEVINNAGANGIVVENNANLIQVLGTTNTNTGNIVVNRNSSPLLRLDYTLWSSPVEGQNLAAFSSLTSQSPSRFYTYDTASNQYSNAFDPTTTNFAAGTGYLIRMPNTADAVTPTVYAGQFTGVPNNGDLPFTLSTAGSAYNLVGNPYPSAINLFTLQSNNSSVIGNTFYMWRTTNAAGTAYCTYVPTTTTTGTYVSNGNTQSPVSFVGNIQPGQGFFVSALTTGPLVFKNGQRVATATSFFKTKQVATADKVWLNATNAAGDFSQMAVTYFDGATPGVDAFDGKYINDSPLALTSNINNEEYTIQGRPAFDAADVVPLNFKTAVAGDYTIAIDHSEGVFAAGQSVILADAITGTETDLTTSSYTFTAPTGTASSRFSLKYQKTLGTNKAVLSDNNVVVYKSKGTLYVNAGDAIIVNIKVYDVQGRLVAELKNGKATSATIANLKATNQVLVVKITSQDNKVVTKKVVN